MYSYITLQKQHVTWNINDLGHLLGSIPVISTSFFFNFLPPAGAADHPDRFPSRNAPILGPEARVVDPLSLAAMRSTRSFPS